jgi:RNA-directed DNA polymerase
MKKKKKLKISKLEYLALRLKSSEKEITELAGSAENRYKIFIAPDKKGKSREYRNPQGRLKVIQKNINELLQGIDLPTEIYSYTKGKGSYANAKYHLGAKWILKLDIKDFFPSISYKRVERLFLNLECSKEIVEILAKLTIHDNQLPQGAPSSPAIANLVLCDFLERTNYLCNIYSFKISVYSDDITISGEKHLKKFYNLFPKIIKQCGFEVKEDKIKIIPNSEEQIITGYRIDRGKVEVPSVKFDTYKNNITHLELENESDCAKLLNSVKGQIAHTIRTNSKQGKELNRLLKTRLKKYNVVESQSTLTPL